MEFEEMLVKYSPPGSKWNFAAKEKKEKKDSRIAITPEELEEYWQDSIYKKDVETLKMFSQARGETISESSALLLVQAIQLKRVMVNLMMVLKDGFGDICRKLDQEKNQ